MLVPFADLRDENRAVAGIAHSDMARSDMDAAWPGLQAGRSNRWIALDT